MTAEHVVEDAAVRQVFLGRFFRLLSNFFDVTAITYTKRSKYLYTPRVSRKVKSFGSGFKLAKGNLTDMPFVIFVAEGLSWHSGTKE